MEWVLTMIVFVLLAAFSGGEEGRSPAAGGSDRRLRFGENSGEFKILQVADMHYADGRETACRDVFSGDLPSCSDLNTTAFLYRIIRDENPDFVVFTGDNIIASDSKDVVKSLNAAFEPVVELGIPWAAVLGNHDQDGALPRDSVMRHITGMRHTLSQFNPIGIDIDGFGNYNLEVGGAAGSPFENKSVLNLYFLDSGDYSKVPYIGGYGWIKPSQQVWFEKTSSKLQKEYMAGASLTKSSAPGIAYFHLPLPEYNIFGESSITGVKQESICSPLVNSGFFTAMIEAGDVKAAFVGHDHINDFCGELSGIHLCYGGGFGYHAYGKAGWPRRARVVSAFLEKNLRGEWGGVKVIKTWKRLDDNHLSIIDKRVVWIKGFIGRQWDNTALD